MDPTLKRINDLLKKFNTTFAISANIVEDEETGGQIASGLKIDELKNDGTVFMDDMFNMFADIIHTVSEDHELVYDVDKGLAIAKKQVIVNYIISEDD